MKQGLVRFAVVVSLFVAMLIPARARAGFAGTDVFVAAVARAAGLNSSQFYTTLLVTNTGASAANVSIRFYARDQSNVSPASYGDTVAPGETKRYDNAVETLFGASGAGAFRVVSSADVLVSSRTFNLPSSGRLEDSSGVFIGSVPAAFAIALGETTELQGVSQGGSENFRTNFGFIETAGQPVTVAVTLKDAQGNTIATKNYDVPAAGQTQYGSADLYPQIGTANGRLEATVAGGSGKVLVYATQTTNGSNDPSAFEMAFRSSLLGSGGGVSSLNGLAGAVTLNAGANVTLTPSGNGLTIAATGGGGSSGVPSVNGISNPVTITGTGATRVTTNGNLITVDSLKLPYAGTASPGAGGETLGIASTDVGVAIRGTSSGGTGVVGRSQSSQAGVFGYSDSASGFGVIGSSGGSIAIVPGCALCGNGDPAVYAKTRAGGALAGRFDGEVDVNGPLKVNGAVTFTPAPSFAPSGPAGGSLTGSYPNPTLALPFAGTANSFSAAISATNTAAGDGIKGATNNSGNSGVFGDNTGGGTGVFGRTNGSSPGVQGENNGTGPAVRGTAFGTGPGILGIGALAGRFQGVVLVTTLAGAGNRAVYSDASGNLTNTSSDARLKRNVADLSTEVDVLDALSRLRGVAFNWDTAVDRARTLGDQREIGFVAQEVEAVVPQVVGTHADGYKSVDYAKLTALLVEVAKAQQARIERLERALAASAARPVHRVP